MRQEIMCTANITQLASPIIIIIINILLLKNLQKVATNFYSLISSLKKSSI